MTLFLANGQVEAHLSLTEGTPSVRYVHPAQTYTVFLRDSNVEPGADPPLLSMQIVFSAPSLQEAKPIAEAYLKEFLDYLVVVTNCKFKTHRILHIFNWEPGVGMRECLYFKGATDPEIPIPGLSGDLLETVALMQQHPIQPRLRRALKWFGNGVGALYRDDQFAYFWFVVELVAQIVKELTPIPDKCPSCGGPLFCPACEVSHLHRPYPKQAIEQLFNRYGGKEGQNFFNQASEVRNRLMHGDEIGAIETRLNVNFSEMVDNLGGLAWTSIINQFVPNFVGKEIALLRTNRYVHMSVSLGAHMQVGFMPKFDDPTPDHFPEVLLSMTTHRKPK